MSRCGERSPLSPLSMQGSCSIVTPLRVLRGALENAYTYPLQGMIRYCNV